MGLLLAGLGGLIVWAVLQGQRPQDHLRQLIDLFGHQHLSGSVLPAFPQGPADRAGSSSGPGLPSAITSGGATPGGALVAA